MKRKSALTKVALFLAVAFGIAFAADAAAPQ
jgi:hypothetical protein